MKQYCRYCVYCIYGDVPFCTMYENTMTDAKIKRANKCPSFLLSAIGDVETGNEYQPREPYRPRKPKEKENYEQLTLWK